MADTKNTSTTSSPARPTRASSLMKTSDSDVSFQNLQDLQYNGVDFLYNLEPQQNNLFMVDAFYDPYSTNLGSIGSGGYDIPASKAPDNIQYRIKKVGGIKLPFLEIKGQGKSPYRWNYITNGREDSYELTIDWVEDVYWTIKRYHMNWLNHWQNRYLDCMVVGQRGKFRNLVLYLFHYVNINKSSATPVQKAMPIARFEFKGLVPKEVGEVDFDWATPGSDEFTQIKYVYNELEVYFYPYGEDDKKYIGNMADFVQFNPPNGDLPWNTGIVGYTTTLSTMNPEGHFGQVQDGLHHSIYYM